MKRFSIGLTLVLSVLIFKCAFGQSPQGMAYQAVVRNASGAPVTSTPVGMRFSILQGGATGTALYVETQSATTNEQGVVTLTIGEGIPVSGTFAAIDWANGPYFLKVEVDPNNQGTYPLSNVGQLQSVPFALHAAQSENLPPMGAITGQVLKWNGAQWSPAADSINTSWSVLNGSIYANTTGNVGVGVTTPASKLEVMGTNSDPNIPLFEVKDLNGNPVFSVYPDGVEVTVDMTTTGRPAKGGFAVSGRNSTRGTTTDIMRVTPDSTTVYINNTLGRPAKGGFAVSGRNSTRAGVTSNILMINADSTRIYTADPNKGFGVGLTSGTTNSYLKLTSNNYFIGQEAGLYNSGGTYNSFMGYQAGKFNGSGYQNIFIGYQSGMQNTSGYSNIFIGNTTGYSNLDGNRNLFIGNQAGYSNVSGFGNTFIGHNAGYTNTGGYRNMFMGFNTGYSNISGNDNTFLGDASGYANTTGSSNTFIGQGAGNQNSTGGANLMLGMSAGQNSTTGWQNVLLGTYAGFGLVDNCSSNVMVGYYSGAALTSGSSNIFVGPSSGNGITTGNYNVCIGQQTGQAATTASSNVIIGHQAGMKTTGGGNVMIGYNAGMNETGTNLLYIDNSNTASPLIYGDFSNNRLVINGNSSNNINNRAFFVNGSAGGTGAWWNDSDKRKKKNIQTIPNALEIILKMRGVKFEWIDTTNHETGPQVGFIAQEVEPILPEVVSNKNDTYSMEYAPITAVLVEAVKAQQQEIDALKKENEQMKSLTKENENLKARLDNLEKKMEKLLNSK
ncbi:MAG TPA: tail fiber domain-containing protein [Williamwhitmania sp.]|nr:tail fiber domain-containing protein [Williamwhitmania sp.]